VLGSLVAHSDFCTFGTKGRTNAGTLVQEAATTGTHAAALSSSSSSSSSLAGPPSLPLVEVFLSTDSLALKERLLAKFAPPPPPPPSTSSLLPSLSSWLPSLSSSSSSARTSWSQGGLAVPSGGHGGGGGGGGGGSSGGSSGGGGSNSGGTGSSGFNVAYFSCRADRLQVPKGRDLSDTQFVTLMEFWLLSQAKGGLVAMSFFDRSLMVC
jgi:hypothetical protein